MADSEDLVVAMGCERWFFVMVAQDCESFRLSLDDGLIGRNMFPEGDSPQRVIN